MKKLNNISPFCLLNGKMYEQLFNYTEDELADFHKAIKPEMLSDIFDAVEEEYKIQKSPLPMKAADAIADYLSILTPEQLKQFSRYHLFGVKSD